MPLRARGVDLADVDSDLALLLRYLSVADPGNNQNALIKHIIGNKNDGFDGNTLYSLGKEAELEIHHVTHIFPEASDLDVILTAGGVANVFGAWVEIQDTDVPANTLASRLTSDAHISSVLIEQASEVDEVHMFEISYGAARTIVTPIRLISGERVFLPPIQQMRIRTIVIPAGQTVYYRMMAETALATLHISFRYHFH